MRKHKDEVKLVLFLAWLVQSHLSLLEEGEDELGGDSMGDEYSKLYLVSKKILEQNKDIAQSPNYNAVAQKLNLQIERTKREVFKILENKNKELERIEQETGEKQERKGCVLMMLIVGALRHCNLARVRGFDELKQIDLASIIARAREEEYLNDWSIHRQGQYFKFGYWEA